MIDHESLTKTTNYFMSCLDALRHKEGALRQAIAKCQSDTTRTPSYRAESAEIERQKHLPSLQSEISTMRKTLAAVRPHREFYESKEFLLSRRQFDPDLSKDSIIRMRYASELKSMSPQCLSLIQRNAMEQNNLALVWACHVAGRDAPKGTPLVDLSKLELPEQTSALQMYDAMEHTIVQAEMLVAEAAGRPLTAMQKLTMARTAQSASGDRPLAA